jgi:hypothetical protein
MSDSDDGLSPFPVSKRGARAQTKGGSGGARSGSSDSDSPEPEWFAKFTVQLTETLCHCLLFHTHPDASIRAGEPLFTPLCLSRPGELKESECPGVSDVTYG